MNIPKLHQTPTGNSLASIGRKLGKAMAGHKRSLAPRFAAIGAQFAAVAIAPQPQAFAILILAR